ncbi:hypothetical protein [Microvirga mediterraneensis]|uniref:Uncharacterized protein n=1 Tax=Microvirga mediterraneensis TaxID=2754695 RepID=A0A838BVI8_9HYPH|nr:hypothetical protein [Microvirga mediterraneensis]MBA1159368.1 hypothetical protein [Microvirga mediterraneensis]
MAQTVGEVLAPVLLRELQKEQAADVAADLQVINEWRGVHPHADPGIIDYAVRRLGLEAAFTFEALALIADEYRSMERRTQETHARNRRIWAAQRYEESAHG